VVFGPGVTVADGALIRSFSHLEGAHVGKCARVGPFARLRPGADLGADVHIGNFVEVKQAKIEAGAKANHLSYIGDARVGAGANVGAGTITCNYDGVAKHRTDIGKGAFIGSNSSLVAPVKIGDGAYVGSGSVVTRNVPADALAIARGEQTIKPGWAKRLRQLKGLGKKKAKTPTK
jgi:bifunctional UDP-N-acetylglucosamine pyrophosphorylase/glucosamine-1-phosphate N-acetyltransferase